MAVITALPEIIKLQNQKIYRELRLGDIVETDYLNELCTIVKKEYPWIYLLVLNGTSYYLSSITELTRLVRVQPFDRPRGFTIAELISEFAIKLEWAHTYNPKIIDNLSYVEILAQLKEYESRIS